jgi:hypothetical protein
MPVSYGPLLLASMGGLDLLDLLRRYLGEAICDLPIHNDSLKTEVDIERKTIHEFHTAHTTKETLDLVSSRAATDADDDVPRPGLSRMLDDDDVRRKHLFEVGDCWKWAVEGTGQQAT